MSQDHYLEYVAIQVSSVFSLTVHLLLVGLFYHFELYPHGRLQLCSASGSGAGQSGPICSAEHVKAVVLACTELCGHAVAAVYFLGLDFGFQYYLWPTTCLAIINSRLDIKWSTLTGLACICLFVLLNLSVSPACATAAR